MNLDRYKPMEGGSDIGRFARPDFTPIVDGGLAGQSSYSPGNYNTKAYDDKANMLMKQLEGIRGQYDPNNSVVKNAINNNSNHTPMTGAYIDKLVRAESGGDYNALNESSGAMGRYQFMPNTVTPFLKSRGKSIADFRSSPALQDEIFKEFTDNNRRGLVNAGYEPSDINMYGAHQQGLGGIIDILKGGSKYTKNIASNIPAGMQPTGANWMKHWGTRF